ncbi:MAG: hypothetical protein LBQ77_00745 [Treponema sp.]|jgi:hypothetical protein|nr:hypothetical protein [Treponema sp.]
MGVFCLLWIPFFYLLWCSFSIKRHGYLLFALIYGGVTALGYHTIPPFLQAGTFGFSRWLFILVNNIAVPLTPALFAAGVFVLFKRKIDSTGFILITLIPVAAIHAIDRSILYHPLYTVLLPILWTTLAVGIPFYARGMTKKSPLMALKLLGIPLLIGASSMSLWGFFVQETVIGIVSFLYCAVSTLVALIFESRRWSALRVTVPL